MIYFFCGAHKNASHYQRYIVEEALKQRGLDFRIAGNEVFNAHRWFAGRQLLRRLHLDRDQRYLCKGHWGRSVERWLLLSVPSVHVFLIWRHILGVMISAFHYENNKFAAGYGDFADFYWAEGRELFIRQVLYRRVWQAQARHPRIFQVTFEDLKADFPTHAGRMLAFAGIEGVDLGDLENKLSLERMRQTRNDPNGVFFRKGEPDEYQTFDFPPEILASMEQLEARSSSSLNLLLARARYRRVVRSRLAGAPG